MIYRIKNITRKVYKVIILFEHFIYINNFNIYNFK